MTKKKKKTQRKILFQSTSKNGKVLVKQYLATEAVKVLKGWMKLHPETARLVVYEIVTASIPPRLLYLIDDPEQFFEDLRKGKTLTFK